MNDLHELDDVLVDHLRRTAEEATPLPQLDAIVASERTTRVTPADRSSVGRGRVLVAAAALAALGVGALAVVGVTRDRGAAPADGPELPAPVAPAAATIGNYVPGGTLGDELGATIEEARFDSEETSYARLSVVGDASAPDRVGTVVASVWRSMSIVTSPPPVVASETPATLDGLAVTVQSDAAGEHHLVEATRPDGDAVRIEGIEIGQGAFVAVIEDLVYAGPQEWSTLVQAMAAPVVTEPVGDTLPFPSDVSVGTDVTFATDAAGITVPAGMSPPDPGVTEATLPSPDASPPGTSAPTGAPTEVDSDTQFAFADVAMLVVDQPSEWVLTSSVQGDVNQAMWSNTTDDGSVLITFTNTGAPPITFAPESYAEFSVVRPDGLFADAEAETGGINVHSNESGSQHLVEFYPFDETGDVTRQLTISFTESSLEDVTDLLSAVRGVDRDEWQQIADASG